MQVKPKRAESLAIRWILVAIRATRPEHPVEVLHDIVVAVPPAAGDLVERFGRSRPRRASLIRRALSRARER